MEAQQRTSWQPVALELEPHSFCLAARDLIRWSSFAQSPIKAGEVPSSKACLHWTAAVTPSKTSTGETPYGARARCSAVAALPGSLVASQLHC